MIELSPLFLRRAAMAWVIALAGLAGCGPGGREPADVGPPLVWPIDSLDTIGGQRTVVLGSPSLVGPAGERAVEFDGIDDGLELPIHPLAGASTFTVEAIFRPDPGGAQEQRFLHLQEDQSEDRILLEIRMAGGGAAWFLDTYVKSADEGYTLFAKQHEHPIGPWYHVALVVDDSEMRHYVNGALELTRPIDFKPQGAGRTSLGVRINRVSWFKGAIREIRFTKRPLAPEEFRRGARGAG